MKPEEHLLYMVIPSSLLHSRFSFSFILHSAFTIQFDRDNVPETKFSSLSSLWYVLPSVNPNPSWYSSELEQFTKTVCPYSPITSGGFRVIGLMSSGHKLSASVDGHILLLSELEWTLLHFLDSDIKYMRTLRRTLKSYLSKDIVLKYDFTLHQYKS